MTTTTMIMMMTCISSFGNITFLYENINCFENGTFFMSSNLVHGKF